AGWPWGGGGLCGAAAVRVAFDAIPNRVRARLDDAERFVETYRRYVWPVSSLEDIRLAPFQVLAGDNGTFLEREHTWQLETIGRLCGADQDLFRTTANMVVDVTDEASWAEGGAGWERLPAGGGGARGG